MRISLIVAADKNDTIGVAGALPWHIPEDLIRFRKLTTGHAVLAGRLTHESIVKRLGHPLKDRTTIVLSRQSAPDDTDDVRYRTDLDAALNLAREIESAQGGFEVFVIGGAEIYRQVLPKVDTIYLTRVNGSYQGDAVMPPGWLKGFNLTQRDVRDGYSFETYERA
jgi:dihydrofolate reductase